MGSGGWSGVDGSATISEPSPDAPGVGDGPVAAQRLGWGGNDCDITAGVMWSRKSYTGYPYGGIGSKPLVQCEAPVKRIYVESSIRRLEWWGFAIVKSGVKSVNENQQRLYQQSLGYKCVGKKNATYYSFSRVAIQFAGAPYEKNEGSSQSRV